MTDKELFLKYNMVPTNTYTKDEILTNKLYNNEIKWEPVNLHHDILILLHGSYACNANCIYCENGELRKKYHNKFISKETLRLLIERLGSNIREITWHGGEPLLIPEDTIEYLEELKKEYHYNFPTTLQTNGILLTDEKIDFLDKLNIQWGTSFDGLQNDTSRGKASTQALLRLIKKYPNKTSFICVNYKDTIDNLINNYEYFKSLGVQATQSCVIKEIVLTDNNPLLIKNEIAIQKVLEYINYWIHDIKNPIGDSYVTRSIERLLGITRVCEDSYCIGGWLIMDPDGNLGFCGHAAEDPGGLGNIRDITSAHDLLYSPKYLSIIGKQVKLEKTCSPCQYYNICHSGCTGLNYEYDHTYNTINPRNCEFQLGFLDGIYELIKDIDTSRRDLYNPMFLQLLRENNYYSLTEIKEIENAKHSNP